jgi:hypothetical protein
MNAKKLILTGVVLVGMVMANGAIALQITPNVGTYYSWDTGGELVARGEVYSIYGGNYSAKAKEGDSFVTFCLEQHEEFYVGEIYDVALSDAAKLGGIDSEHGSVDGRDPISVGTAFLYSEFASGSLAQYDYENANGYYRADAILIQETIWYLEQEIDSIDSDNKFYQHVLGNFGNDLNNARANNMNGQHGVAVMSLTGHIPERSGYGNAQDLLVYVPDGGLTAAMLGFGLAGISAVRRRFRKS